MAFLGHTNLEADYIRMSNTANIAMPLPKELYPLSKDVSIPSKWLFAMT